MSASPQPPSPHGLPPRSGSYGMTIVLLILGLIIAAAVAAIWFGVALIRHNVHVQVTQQAGNRKDVQIQTPVGNFEVRKGEQATEAQLGLPFYPGSTRVTDENDDGAVGLSFNFPDQNDVRIYVAKFQSPDALDQVREFYTQRLGDAVTKYTVKDKDGNTVLDVDRLSESNFKADAGHRARRDEGKITFEIKEKDQQRVVSLESKDGGTRITLVRALHTHAEAN